MNKSRFVSLIAFSGFLFLLLGSEEINTGSEHKRFGHYLIGIKYLELATSLSIKEKIAYYNKLVQLTGFTAVLAKSYLEQFEDNPQKWEKIISSVIKNLESGSQLNKE